ncbi:MAG: hypothetical protein KIT58_10540 [Planctomycetota bacterium]|nr:hypothetical protein [Planctomycetota bacterium]
MTDQRLRALERDALHGDVEAQARLLLERVRVGDLTEERLRLAAYLGDERARLALGESAPEPPDDIVAWVRGLDALGSEVATRVALVKEVEPDRTYLRGWVLGFAQDRAVITKRAREAYTEHLLPWALASRGSST